MFPLPLTARHGIHRLPPNHRLDLITWQTSRTWPQTDLPVAADGSVAAREVAEIAKRHIAAVAARYPLTLALTAGRDSRTILACARPFAAEATLFTSNLPSSAAAHDVSVARQITRDLGLQHTVIPYEASSPREQMLFCYRTGSAVSNRLGVLGMRSVKRLDASRAYLSSYISEVGRAFFDDALDVLHPAWRDEGVTATDLVSLTGAPLNRETEAAMGAWLASQPLTIPEQIVSLFYAENRMGAWVSVLAMSYADSNACQIYPLNHRRVLAHLITLPLSYRRAAQINTDIIATEWPELLAFPFNTPDRRFVVRQRALRAWNRLRKQWSSPKP